MITVSVLYPRNTGTRFDADYYVKRHVPLALARMGSAVKGVFVEIGIGGAQPEQEAPFAAAFHAFFESVEAFEAAFLPHAEEIQADIPNYTDIAPVIQTGRLGFADLKETVQCPAQ